MDIGFRPRRTVHHISILTVTNIIGKAAQRLEELRRAGIEVSTPGPGAQASPRAESAPLSSDGEVRTLHRIRTPSGRQFEPSTVEGDTSFTTVELDLDSLAEQGFLTPTGSDRALADDFRIIKMRLLKNVAQAAEKGMPRSNVVLVASALPGEGKTYFSINLALSLAMTMDHSVLLVDADVLRPSVLSRLGVEASKGLTDLLMNPSLSLPDVVVKTNVPKLSLLPSGRLSDKASELIASSAMEDLLTQLAARNPDRIIVLDGPPVLVTTVARALAPRVGQVVMVVEAGRTTSAAVTEAFAALESCPIVSAVLNKSASHSHGAGYGYGYYAAQ